MGLMLVYISLNENEREDGNLKSIYIYMEFWSNVLVGRDSSRYNELATCVWQKPEHISKAGSYFSAAGSWTCTFCSIGIKYTNRRGPSKFRRGDRNPDSRSGILHVEYITIYENVQV